MNEYAATLRAFGIPADQAERDAFANDLQFWRNREMPQYGQVDPPSAEEVREAYEFKFYGVERDAD